MSQLLSSLSATSGRTQVQVRDPRGWKTTDCVRGDHRSCLGVVEFNPPDEWIACGCEHHGRRTQGQLREEVARILARKSARVRKQSRPCRCHCGDSTRGGRFLPGHDARLRSQLLAIARGDGPDRSKAREELEELGWQRFL